MDPNAKLNELPSLLTNMHKEKLISTGASSDKMDVACKKVITEENLNEFWKLVDEQCKKIASNLPKTNAYFKRMLFQEMHMCIILRALKSKSIIKSDFFTVILIQILLKIANQNFVIFFGS